MIMCITSSCFNHCATSDDVLLTIVTVYVYWFGWWRTSGVAPAAPPTPRYDVAGPSINMDLLSINMDFGTGAAQGLPGTQWLWAAAGNPTCCPAATRASHCRVTAPGAAQAAD